VCHHHLNTTQEVLHPSVVNPLALHHVVGDVVNGRHLRRNREARIFEFVKDLQHSVYHTRDGVKFKQQHAQFNHAILLRTEAGGFGIQHHAFHQRCAGGHVLVVHARNQAAQDAVVRVLFQGQSPALVFMQVLGHRRQCKLG